MKRAILAVCVLSLIVAAGCAGVQQRGNTFVASGYSFNILFQELPENAMVAAQEKIPANATITNVSAYPNDQESLPGILNLILGIGSVQIGGTVGQ